MTADTTIQASRTTLINAGKSNNIAPEQILVTHLFTKANYFPILEYKKAPGHSVGSLYFE